MMIYQKQHPEFRLKTIETSDLDDLRNWKNENRQFFFYKEIITEEQQQNWFEKHQKNDDDFMFVVQEESAGDFVNIGCMGYRLEDDHVDVYNIMRGRSVPASTHSMAEAFQMMNNYIAESYDMPISCVVLTDNPARKWYEKLGFISKEQREDHVLHVLDKSRLPLMELVTT